jgi:hypothetical protein
MNVLSALIKCAAVGLLVGFVMSAGPDMGGDILPLAALLAVISTILILLELSNMDPVIAVPAKAPFVTLGESVKHADKRT